MLKLDGGDWIDIFGVAIIVRIMLVLLHFPPLTAAEAGTWAAAITSFAFSNTNGPRT